MGFSREMDHSVDVVVLENGLHSVEVADVGFLEEISFPTVGALDIAQAFRIARVCEHVHIYDCTGKPCFREDVPNEVGPDESSTARNKQPAQPRHFL